MKQKIIGFHLDDEQHCVARLACGHNQHVRHNPPFMVRNWVLSAEGRDKMLGYKLNCVKCQQGAERDWT